MPPMLPRKRLRTPSPQPTPEKKTRSLPSRKARPDAHATYDTHNRANASSAENQKFLEDLEDISYASSSESEDDFEEVLPPPPAKKAKKSTETKKPAPKRRMLKDPGKAKLNIYGIPIAQPPPQQKKSNKRSDAFSSLDKSTKAAPSAADNKAFLDALEDDQSSLSSASESEDSDDFEDVLPPPKRSKVSHKPKHEDSDEDLEFEDIAHANEEEELVAPEITENFEITIKAPGNSDEPARLTLKQGGKASITKKQRRARILAHQMHVQFLLWHNVIRNNWINDQEVHAILFKGLPEALKTEVADWKRVVGHEEPSKIKSKKGKGKCKKEKNARERIRDWGADADKSAQNTQADPLIRLLKYLASYWKKRFVVTAPSLRKLGYRNPRDMRAEMDSFNDGPHDPARHGESIVDLDEFREWARKCKGSRDIGAQLFTALLRGMGIEARMVASLQCTGFGWSKIEEAHPRKDPGSTATTEAVASDSEVASSRSKKPPTKPAKKAPNGSAKKGSSNRPINLDSDISSLSSSLSSDEEKATKVSPSKTPLQRFDRDLVYPTYWTEVLTPTSNTYVPVSTLVHPNVVTSAEHIGAFEPRGAAAEKGKQVMAYVVAFSSDGTAKDVTVRYLRKRIWPGKTKGFRIPIEKMPVYDGNGKVKKWEEYDWFKRVMRGYARPGPMRTLADDIEDEGDLVPVQPVEDKKKDAEPETLQGYKQSPKFVLERHMRREEALLPGTKPVKHFHIGKADKAVPEPVYLRAQVVLAKSVETWHKEGRQVKIGEQPLKRVPYRAVTLQRKREIEDQAKDMDGQRPLQALYAQYQTEWIIPDPIGPDRAIPKNAFNNIDVYVPSMIPKGAIHIPLKGTARVCKKLGIDFAEACTGFEFGKQRAVPVITGVVVAEENEDMVIDAWEEEERVKAEKEDKKRQERSLKLWKVFFKGLQVRERIRKEYGGSEDEVEGAEDVREWAGKNAFGVEKKAVEAGGFLRDSEEDDGGGFVREDEGGGFLQDGEEGAHSPRAIPLDSIGGSLLPPSDDETEANASGFEIVGGSQDPKKRKRFDAKAEDNHLPAPISLQAMHAEQTEPLSDEDTDGVEDEDEDVGGANVEVEEDGSIDEAEQKGARASAAATGLAANAADDIDDDDPSDSSDGDDGDDGDESDFAPAPKKNKSTFLRATPAMWHKQREKARDKRRVAKAQARKERLAKIEKPATPKRRSKRNAAPTSSPYFSH